MSLKLDRLSTLIAEDTEPMRELVAAVLARWGVGKILTATNGNEAFRVFCLHNPDIVITDWHMLEGNGLDLIANIRRAPASPNRTAPVIMLTGYNAQSRVKQSRDLGATEFLTKPFRAEDLIRRIAHVIRRPRDFILNPSFFGPDRRRHNSSAPYTGPHRRISDRPLIELPLPRTE